MAYLEDLKDPRWQRKRLEIFDRDDWACRACGAKDKPLTVHHSCYLPRKKPWEYEDAYLFTLCDDCHNEADAKYGSQYLIWTALLLEKGRLEGRMTETFDPILSKKIDCVVELLDNCEMFIKNCE